MLHLNLGLERDADVRATRMNWGVAGELRVHPRAWVGMEAYASGRRKPNVQLGIRYQLIEDRFTVYGGIGSRIDGKVPRFVLGFVLSVEGRALVRTASPSSQRSHSATYLLFASSSLSRIA